MGRGLNFVLSYDEIKDALAAKAREVLGQEVKISLIKLEKSGADFKDNLRLFVDYWEKETK